MNGIEPGVPTVLKKRRITPAFVFFYILFWPDTWRILIGMAASAILSPLLISPDHGRPAAALLYLMIACIAYSASAAPGRAIAGFLQKRILPRR
jgi:hypothetical protein